LWWFYDILEDFNGNGKRKKYDFGVISENYDWFSRVRCWVAVRKKPAGKFIEPTILWSQFAFSSSFFSKLTIIACMTEQTLSLTLENLMEKGKM
jgi:hypothetical protein